MCYDHNENLKKINILNNQWVKDEMAREIRKYFDIKRQ